jgi:predicted nucleic acid-binding protein
MTGPLCLLDTNILLRWIKPDDRDYPLVSSAIERLLQDGNALCRTSQNVAEFWNTCTRPLGQNGYGLSPEQTDQRVKLFENNLRLLPDSVAVHEEWRKLIVAHNVRGVQVHDARLAAAMRVHGVERILTFNEADFARYPGIEAVHPRTISKARR